jgi:hypothetical protein
MTRLIELVSRRISTVSVTDADVWPEILRDSAELGDGLQALVRWVLTGQSHSVARLDRDDVVGLAMTIMAKFRVYSEPVWSSHTLREHLDRFFSLPDASTDALLEGEAIVLPDSAAPPLVAFVEELHRILSFERPGGITAADAQFLLTRARRHRKVALWLHAFWAAQRTSTATAEVLAEAMLGVRSPDLRASIASGLSGALARPEALVRCMNRVRELQPAECHGVTEAVRAAGMDVPLS